MGEKSKVSRKIHLIWEILGILLGFYLIYLGLFKIPSVFFAYVNLLLGFTSIAVDGWFTYKNWS